MTSEQRFIVGLAAGAAAVLAGARIVRRRHAIDFAGRIVVITGGSRGLGFAIAREFASLRSRVVICARNNDELDRAAAELRRSGAEVLTVQCDVANQDQVTAMVSRVNEHFGQIDVLVNNAGIISVGPIESQTI